MMASREIHTITSIHALLFLLDSLSDLPPPSGPLDRPSLYCDVTGQDGRQDGLDVFSLYVLPADTVYLVEVHTLKEKAFCTTNYKGTSLQSILESAFLPKALFDTRNTSAALFTHYGIRLSCAHDIQLMELASRPGGLKRTLGDLLQCIESCPEISAPCKESFSQARRTGSRLHKSHAAVAARPQRPRANHPLAERPPMSRALVDFCAAGVSVLPALWESYARALRDKAFWRSLVRGATLERIRASQRQGRMGDFRDGGGRDRMLGPPSWIDVDEERDAWNVSIMDETARGGRLEEHAFGQFIWDYR